jgi:DDE superfamily endonuclease
MWVMIPSLESLVQTLAVVFTQPGFQSHCQVLLGWLMCLGSHTEFRVFRTAQADTPVLGCERHPFDRFYNLFSRAAWTVSGLGYHLAVAVVTRLNPSGVLHLVVDDTLLHKRGTHVYGLGWFRDAVASTRKRVATASGNNWVVLGLVIAVPFCPRVILCLPLAARLHLPGKGQPSCVALAKEMLAEVRTWFPQRRLILCGDGAYAAKGLLQDLDGQVTFVGRLRGDAALHDPQVPARKGSRRGRKATKGPRLPSPKEMARRADRKRKVAGAGTWQRLEVMAYGKRKTFQVVSYEALWSKVLGTRPVLVVVVRDPDGKMDDTYLFTTDVKARPAWVIETFAQRWSIEVAFKASKQVLDIEGPQHWCRSSIEKLAPWVWSMQTLITVWYLTEGYNTDQAEKARTEMGEWESEWSLRHMHNILREEILAATININSQDPTELRQIITTLKNYVKIAV